MKLKYALFISPIIVLLALTPAHAQGSSIPASTPPLLPQDPINASRMSSPMAAADIYRLEVTAM